MNMATRTSSPWSPRSDGSAASRNNSAPSEPALFDPDGLARSFVLEASYGAATFGTWHSHRKAQLVHASEGVLHVMTAAGAWIVPPHRAIWVPSLMRHRVASKRRFRLLTLYTRPGLVKLPGKACQVVAVDRLLEELLAVAARFGTGYPDRGPEARLMRVILDRLPALTTGPLFHLPSPRTREMERITVSLVASPGDDRALDDWAREVGLGAKTCARRFLAETGLTFGQWRRQCRVVAAIEGLAAGHSVTRVALDVGYEDVSSFIAVFKRATGVTPARFFLNELSAEPGRKGSDGVEM